MDRIADLCIIGKLLFLPLVIRTFNLFHQFFLEYEPHLENNEGHNHNSENMYNMVLGYEIFRTFSPVIMVLNILTLGLHIIVLARLRKTADPEYDPTLDHRKELENQFKQFFHLIEKILMKLELM